ncbi:uncharacterized protein Nmag_3792 (plasmid) [Natrialba magadii ATCC 43099]|nr:hypothetical protein [Natrialba magadii]ADD07333.1 uncharacterized protein Nmag_3792 [Natrialba magadii ATCC 43099]
MTNETDRIYGYPRKTVILEACRLSYAIAIAGAVTLLAGLGRYWADSEILRSAEPFTSVILLVVFPIALILSLYIYDRRHEEDLVIADAVLYVIQPIIRLLKRV